MVQVESVQWVHDGWEVRCRVDEGVYHLKGYPVRITHLAYTDNIAVHSALKTVVRGLLERHMRRGSVPPHAMVLDWVRAQDICEGAASDMEAACRTLVDMHLLVVGSAVSNHF